MKLFIQLTLALALLTPVLNAQSPNLDAYLTSGKLQDGLTAFAKPSNDADRFSLAVLQSLQGLQQFADGAGKLGIKQSLAGSGLPFFRVLPRSSTGPVEPATPEKVRQLFQNLRDALTKANATLAKVGTSDFKVQINLSQAHLENKDGTPGMPLSESLGRILGLQTSSKKDLVVNFDSADALWLKGYTHVLLGLLDVFMAYDWRPVWNQAAQTLFTSPDPLPPFAKYTVTSKSNDFSEWVDIIAAIHDMRLELSDADGLKKAVTEFRAAIVCSKACWTRILAETDDDQEWLPNPKQTGPHGSKVTQEQIDGWLTILAEVDAILTGKKLLPHWRVINGMGINVAKLAQTPPKFDLVLFIQGSAFAPYIQGGEVSTQAQWRNLIAPFGPGFSNFALWSN